MSLTIRPVREANSRLGRAFAQLPFGLYRDVTQWVPPLTGGIRRIIDRSHPFFSHSRGEAFVIMEDARVVARYLLLDPVFFNEYRDRHEARIGMPEAIDRDDVWTTMFDHAREWASERRAEILIGPRLFSPMDGSGVLVEGFEHRASMTMMPWHHPWVGPHFERAGFRKHKDFVSAYVRAEDFDVPEKVRRVAEIAGRRSSLSVTHPAGARELRSVAREVGAVYNGAWSDHPEFRPLTDQELTGMTSDLARVVRPEMIPILRGPEGDVAGFVLPFPDLSPALQRARGHLGLRGILDIRREQRRARHIIVNGLGVLPEYRRQGGTALLYVDLIDRCRAAGAESAEMTQIAETTDLMLSDMGTLGGTVYKRHRVYELPL